MKRIALKSIDFTPAGVKEFFGRYINFKIFNNIVDIITKHADVGKFIEVTICFERKDGFKFVVYDMIDGWLPNKRTEDDVKNKRIVYSRVFYEVLIGVDGISNEHIFKEVKDYLLSKHSNISFSRINYGYLFHEQPGILSADYLCITEKRVKKTIELNNEISKKVAA